MAALLVMLHHFKLHLNLDVHLPSLQWLLQKGYGGVDLFFVLSGFVMSMTYGGWFDGSRALGLLPYARFLVRRVARVWPLHAAMLGVVVLLGLLEHGPVFGRNTLLANLALVQAWGLSAAMNPPAWSVSTEMFAYTVFPLLVVLALRGRVRPALCAAAVAGMLWFVTRAGLPLGPGRRGPLDVYFNYSFLPVLRCLAGFTTGMLAWRATGWAAVRRLAGLPWAAPAALAAVLALMLGRADDLWIFPLLPAVVLAAHCGRGWCYRALGHGALHRLGVLSYAIYLTHLVLLDQFPFAGWPLGLSLPVYLLATLAAAIAAHAAVEVPGRRWLRLWGEGMLDRLPPLGHVAPRHLHGPPQ